MVVAILASALGTHHEIARLPKTVVQSQTLGGHFRELWETVKNRGFLILMLAGICAYTNQGISYALSNYTYSYVWQFKSWTLQLLPFALMLGAALAFVIAPAVGKRMSKPHAHSPIYRARQTYTYTDVNSGAVSLFENALSAVAVTKIGRSRNTSALDPGGGKTPTKRSQ